MRIAVVTSSNFRGYDTYGHRFLSSFVQWWNPTQPLLYYSDPDLMLASPFAETIFLRNLYHSSTWLEAFVNRYKNDPQVNGQRGYRWNAVKFAHKVAAILAADYVLAQDITHLLWLDADVVTHALVTPEVIASWLPDPAWLSWLDRDPAVINYPECGFLLINRKHLYHLTAMSALEALYVNGTFRTLGEYHDSYIWQHLVQSLVLPVRSMSGEGYRHLHVLVHSPLGAWFDHCKGPNRKVVGRTQKSELKIKRSEPYWR